MRVYHVTESKRVPRIQRQGLRLQQTSNWVNPRGERLGGGALYAFEEWVDAVRWAARMDWAQHKQTGSGKISILTLETEGITWDPDFTDTLTQASYAGQWLKAYQPIPCTAIKAVTVVEDPLVRALVQSTREEKHETP